MMGAAKTGVFGRARCVAAATAVAVLFASAARRCCRPASSWRRSARRRRPARAAAPRASHPGFSSRGRRTIAGPRAGPLRRSISLIAERRIRSTSPIGKLGRRTTFGPPRLPAPERCSAPSPRDRHIRAHIRARDTGPPTQAPAIREADTRRPAISAPGSMSTATRRRNCSSACCRAIQASAICPRPISSVSCAS